MPTTAQILNARPATADVSKPPTRPGYSEASHRFLVEVILDFDLLPDIELLRHKPHPHATWAYESCNELRILICRDLVPAFDDAQRGCPLFDFAIYAPKLFAFLRETNKLEQQTTFPWWPEQSAWHQSMHRLLDDVEGVASAILHDVQSYSRHCAGDR